MMDETHDDRTLSAVVLALVKNVEAINPAFMTACAGIDPALANTFQRTRMLRIIRRRIRTTIRAAIRTDGYRGVLRVQDGTFEPDLAICLPDNDAEEAEHAEIEAHLHGVSIQDEEGDPPPSLAVTKQAIKFIFSTAAAFEIAVASASPLRFTAKGGQRFKAFAAGKHPNTDADIARAAVARSVIKLATQFDEQTLRALFPNASAVELRSPRKLSFIRDRIREAIDVAVAKGGYSELVKIEDWRMGSFDADFGASTKHDAPH